MNALTISVFLTLAVSAFALPANSKELSNNLFYLANLTDEANGERINFYQVQVNLTQDRFTSFAKSLRYQNQLVSNTLFNGERNLTAIGFLNFTNQECVIHYGKLPEVTTVQKTINDCVDTALFNGQYLFQKVTVQLDAARKENQSVGSAIANCNNNATGSKLSECVKKSVQSVNTNVSKLLNSADRDLQLAYANYDDLAQQAVECTYNVVNSLGRDVQVVLRTISECQSS